MSVRNRVRLGRPLMVEKHVPQPWPDQYLGCTIPWGGGAVLRVVGYSPAFVAPTRLLILAPPAMTTNYVSWEGNCHLLGTTGLEGVIPRAHTGPRTV